jgi:quinol-cytochrome oxidoreductase complex cytochrome b subunit
MCIRDSVEAEAEVTDASEAAAPTAAAEDASAPVEPVQVVALSAAPSEPDDPHHWDGPSVPFVPDHALLEGMMALAFLTVMLGMISFIPAPLEARANPYLSPAGVLPEWYLLPPFELLHLVPPLPGMLATGLAVGVLMFWPFIDRKPRRISRRPYMFALSILIILSLIGLSVYSVMKVAAEKVG